MLLLARRRGRWRGAARQAAAGRLPARRGPGLPVSRACSCPTPPRWSAPTRSASRSRRSSRRRRASQSYNTIAGFSLLSTVHATYNAFFFVTLEGVGRAHGAREQYQAIQRAHEPRAREAARGDRVRVPAAGDSGRRHGGRLHVHARRTARAQRRRVPRRERAAASWPRRASVPRSRRSTTPFVARRAAGLRRRGPRQGAEAGRRPRATSTHAPGVHGRRLRQRLQPLRPAVAGLRAGRGRVPHATPRTSAQFYVRNARATMVPLSALVRDRSAIRARVHHALQPVPRGADQRHARRRATARRRRWRRSRRSSPRRMPPEMGYD